MTQGQSLDSVGCENRGGQVEPSSCPFMAHKVGRGRYATEQPRAEENQPQLWGVPLPCLQRLGPWLGPGRVRRRQVHTQGLVQAAAVLEREQL